MDINSIEKLLKTNKTKLNAITSARLEHEKETSASDIADRVLPFIKMPSAQEITLNPWLAGGMSVLESILAAILMKGVSNEKKRNRARAVELLNKEEVEGKTEKERIMAFMNKMMGNYDTKQNLEHDKAKADIAKVYQDIAESKAKPGLAMAQIEYKEKKQADKEEKEALAKKIADQIKQIEALGKTVSPKVKQQMVEEANRGEFDMKNYPERATNLFDDLVIFRDRWGTGKDRYRRAVEKAEEKPKVKVKAKVDADGNIIELDGDDPRVLEFKMAKTLANDERKRTDVKRALLTAANGAAFGAFPEVAGRVKGQMRGMRDFAKAMMLDHRLINPMSKAAAELNRNEYLKTKGHLQHDIAEFAKEHPTASMFADIAGSIPTAVVLPGGGAANGAKFLSKVGKAAKAGAIFGGSRGVGESVNADANLEDMIKSALKGAAVGGATGGVVGAVLSPFTSSNFAKLKNSIGESTIRKSIKEGVPLLENADERVMQFAEDIKARGNPIALKRYANFGRKMDLGQKDKIKAMIKEHLSDKDYNDLLSQIQKEGESIYNPLYKEAMKAGEIPRPRTQNSSVLKDYIKKARKTSDRLRELPDNHIEVLQGAKGILGDDITAAKKFGETFKQTNLEKLQKDLIKDIDDSVLTHSKAREAYARTKRQEEALKRGFKDVPKATLDEIEAMRPIDLPQAEQNELLRVGAAQSLKNKAFNAPKTNANIFRNVFADDDLERFVKAKMMSPEGMNKLRDAAYAAEKSINNIHKLTSGSQTAEKLIQMEDNNPLRFFVAPVRKTLQLSDKLWEKLSGSGDARTAKYLTDVRALKSAAERERIKSALTKDAILYKLLGGRGGKKKKED